MMETAIVAAVSSVVTVALTIGIRLFSGGQLTGSVTARLESIETAIIGLQADFRKLSEVLIELATVRGDIRLTEQRVGRLENDIREMRHGEGFVFPLFSKAPPPTEDR